MKFIKKYGIFILIIILTIFLRLNIDTFIYGLNYDEFAIISLAKLNFTEMLKAISKEDYHAPLYYIFCHILLKLPNSFLTLRLANILFSTINVIFFYKIGKILINKRFGLLMGLFFAINHLQITTANFIKYYCLNILLITLSIYFLLNYIKYNKYKIGLIIINFLIPLSFTYGIVFVIIEYLTILHLKSKKETLKLWISSLSSFILYLPILLTQTKSALGSIISPHSNSPAISFFGFYAFLNDYFSPLTNYSCNTETLESMGLLVGFLKNLSKGEIDYLSIIIFILFSLIPVIIGLLGIFLALKKKKNEIKILSIISFLYFIFAIVIIFLKINGFVPLYIYPSGIILIILSLYGLFELKNKIKYVLIGYLILAQLLVSNVYPKEKRINPTKHFTNLDYVIEKINPNTPIIMFEGARFAKYYYKDKNIIPIDYDELSGTHGEIVIKNIYNTNSIEELKTIIKNNKKPQNIEKYCSKNIFNKTKKSNELILIYNSNETEFILNKYKLNKKIENNLSNSTISYQLEKNHKKISQSEFGKILQSYTTEKIINEIEKKYKPSKIEQYLPIPLKNYQKYSQLTQIDTSITDYMKKPLMGWIIVTYQKQ